MALSPGTRLGVYEVTAQIGAGGMGEVYRATDRNLKRSVAIKVLPASVAGDTDRLARFQREAEVLAALNHPNIAGIYGLERTPELTALVMELVEGEDLSQRIARGAIPIDEALPIAKQIAEALEEAHARGIIHRDLKPANVKVTSEGKVKVLDFGLAKALEPAGAAASASASLSPTITSPAMTQAAMILGTAAYMSPEQAKGRAVDKRTDLWAFGCVLYEMLTARRPFQPTRDAAGSDVAGETVAEALAAVLTKEPDWAALPATTPASIRRLLRRCVEKDRKRRLADAADIRLELEEAEVPGASASLDEADVQARVDAAVATARAQLRRGMRVQMAAVSAVALVAIAATGGGMWLATRPQPPRIVQSTIATTPATAVTISGIDRDVAITPDGARVVYAGNRGRELFVRPLDALEPLRVFTGAPRGPFVSPDGQWVGFIDATNTLKKVAISGGPAVTLSTLDGGSRGAVWLPDDAIVFATNTPATGLLQVAAGGGPVTVLTRPDRARSELDHVWPEALPGGQAVLFTIVPATGGLDAAQIAVFDRQTQTQTVVVRGGSHAHYVASSSTGSGQAGYLVYAAGGTLQAVAFDAATRTTRGPAAPVVPEVVTTTTAPAGGVEAGVAVDGTLVYLRGTEVAAQRTLAWVNRQGRETTLAAPPRAYLYPRVSPDGGRVVVAAVDQESDLWVWDVARLTLTRLTFTPSLDDCPVWSPDGQRVFFTSAREGTLNLYAQAANGTGAAERLTTSRNQTIATGITPDGTRLLFTELAPQTRGDVMQVTLTGTPTVTPLVQTPANERNGIVSPDGRWLAYEADDSGRMEIYVRPYPEVARGRWQVSTGGGTQPLWSRDGRELFYVSPTDAVMRVGVERGAVWTATTPTILLKDGSVPAAGVVRNYDVSPDGQRFLVLKDAAGPNAAATQLMVVQHFDALLKRLVPEK